MAPSSRCGWGAASDSTRSPRPDHCGPPTYTRLRTVARVPVIQQSQFTLAPRTGVLTAYGIEASTLCWVPRQAIGVPRPPSPGDCRLNRCRASQAHMHLAQSSSASAQSDKSTQPKPFLRSLLGRPQVRAECLRSRVVPYGPCTLPRTI